MPLRWHDRPADEGAHAVAVQQMATYLRDLSRVVDVTVVDGSSDALHEQHRQAWGPWVRLLRPDPDQGLNGKVAGAVTGLRRARHEAVVLADDDVRYDERTLRQVVDRLEGADLVRPANVFDRWPWHAQWDGSRSLLNRALAADWPGTFALRRGTVLAVGGWSADVLFENLELVRTVRVAGGVVRNAPDLLVHRVPPTTRHFRSQRVRQAYDDLAQPWRLATALGTLPALAAGLRRCPAAVLVAVGAVVAVAERGRRRAGAARLVPATVPLFAPLWLVERGTCSWLAVLTAVRGGVRYGDGRILVAAHSTLALRRRLQAAGPHVDRRR